jgi:hypothetical protein
VGETTIDEVGLLMGGVKQKEPAHVA